MLFYNEPMDLHNTAPRAGLARRAWEDIPNLLSLLVFFTVTALLFRSLEFALIVTASLGFHELGHAVALTYLGLEWRITFGWVGAWTWSPSAQRARLSQFANAFVHLAGPFFSLLLALVALALQALWQPGGSSSGNNHLLILANFSAQVGVINLLPFGSLTDGGKIVQRITESLDRASRPWVVLLPLLVSALMLVLYSLVELPRQGAQAGAPFLLGLLLVGFWLASSLAISARTGSASAAAASATAASATAAAAPAHRLDRRMTALQVFFLILLVWDLLVLGLILSASTPFWLSPEYLMGSLRNVVDVLILLN